MNAPLMSAQTEQKELLDGLLVTVAAADAAIVLFDLDDTLFSTANRHLRILREFATCVESKDAQAAGLLRALTRERLRYAIIDTVKDAGLAEALAKDLKNFWFARFFTNPYLLEDDIIAGGPDFVAEVVKLGGKAIYITGRDEGMREGTEASLARHAFPEPNGRRVHLILKPSFDTPDLAFKTGALRKLVDMGDVVGSFENEPAHANLFVEHFPQARHFLLETKHSGKPIVPHPTVSWIKDFQH